MYNLLKAKKLIDGGELDNFCLKSEQEIMEVGENRVDFDFE
jgi:hypothetical protein